MRRQPRCRTLVTLAMLASAGSLSAQASGPSRADPSDLPRFTLREIVAGRNDSLSSIPGAWVRAATLGLPESLAVVAYRAAAARSGVAPLEGATLAAQRSQHVMGLYRRTELVRAAQRTLEAIRVAIPSNTTRARFDLLFRPRGEWIVDLHEAALAWARARVPGIGWESARPALAAVGWLPKGDSAREPESIPRALYGLTVLGSGDSTALAGLRGAMWRADSGSASAAFVLLGGYAAGQSWYADVMAFFLTQPWTPGEGKAYSLRDYVREDWRRVRAAAADSATLPPETRPRLFGYPQAVPHYGVPPVLFRRLVSAENDAARVWLAQHGPAALLQAIRYLPPGDTNLALLQAGRETVRLTTIPRQARESLNGFLEPSDLIAIDPGYSPLLALGALVHEWQHLIFRRVQLEDFASRLTPASSPFLDLPGIQPYLAEGFAEWSTERILAPIVERWPLLGLGELEKRAGLAQESADDQHSLGYALVVELAEALKDPAATTRILLRYPEAPASIMNDRALRQVWQKYRRAPDYVFAAPARRLLIPEVTFTIEDGYPDVIATRILVPPNGKGAR